MSLCFPLCGPGDAIGPLYPRHVEQGDQGPMDIVARGDYRAFPIQWSTPAGLPKAVGCVQGGT